MFRHRKLGLGGLLDLLPGGGAIEDVRTAQGLIGTQPRWLQRRLALGPPHVLMQVVARAYLTALVATFLSTSVLTQKTSR